jgi:hypothetical protein
MFEEGGRRVSHEITVTILFGINTIMQGKKGDVIRMLKQSAQNEGADVFLWELGHSRHSHLWEKIITNSHVVIIFVDGTLEDVLRGRQLGSSVKSVAPHMVVNGIAIKYRQDTLTEERISQILGVPAHLLNINDVSFETQLIEILQQLIKEGVKVRRPEPIQTKEPPIDKSVLLAMLRGAFKRKLLNDETIEEIVGAVERGSKPALAKAREIMMGAEGPDIPVHYIDQLLSDCQMQFQREGSR